MGSIAVVIVTHNSAIFISKLLATLEAQTLSPDLVVFVDSGSSDTGYLDCARKSFLRCTVILKQNIGFAVGCNTGWHLSKDYDFVLFLNPDAFLTPDFLKRAVEYMETYSNRNVGMLTGTLLGYDVKADRPTGLVDSTCVMHTWYGQSIDRDQRAPISILKKYVQPNSVPAICGAALLARQATLQDIAEGDILFDPGYFMYKEDIDLSWKAVRSGWILIHHPGLIAYHCRGWKGRRESSRRMRLLSARNDVKLFVRFRSPYVIYAILKYALVWSFNI
ncbi:MAG TPA: glycosyltransferase family 2 protein [Edaphobacter sp.]|nr:glycosyltransferase family 2 protein [Edaphobacter sp.]